MSVVEGFSCIFYTNLYGTIALWFKYILVKTVDLLIRKSSLCGALPYV